MCLNQARYGISWGAIGAAMSCYDTALQYAQARKQFHDTAHCESSTCAGQAGVDGHGDHEGAIASLQVGRLKDEGNVELSAHLDGEKE